MKLTHEMIEAGCNAFLEAFGDPAARPMDYAREITAAPTTPPADLREENERLQEQLSACMEMVDPSAMELGTYKARAAMKGGE